MVKIEGIYKGHEKIGQEILLDEQGFLLILGNGKKERFFDLIDEEIDLSLFVHHLGWVKEKKLEGYSFINLKPKTLIKHFKEIVMFTWGKVVIELREDVISDREIERIASLRSDFPFLLSLDDFGRKGSNIDRLSILKPNFIKVDMSLFKDASSLVNFVLFLQKASPDSVLIAEKVEDERTYKIARGAGIELWQGWYEKKFFKEAV